MGKLDGKVAMITGGGRGQGRSHAITLAKEGADIVVTDLCEDLSFVEYGLATEADLAETVAAVEALDRRCLGIRADARSSAEMQAVADRTIEEFGRIDVLSANAAIATAQEWDEVTDEIWNETIEGNLSSVWRTVRPVIPHMVEQGGGSIVLTSSSAGLLAYLGLIPYITAKAGLLGLMKALAVELGSSNIRVNAICPSNTATPMFQSQPSIDRYVGHENGTLEELEWLSRGQMILPIPWLEAVDQSNALLFLASDDARYITGVTLPVDGGTALQPPGLPPLAFQKIAELENERDSRPRP